MNKWLVRTTDGLIIVDDVVGQSDDVVSRSDDRKRIYDWFKSTGLSVHYNCWESHMRTKEECTELLESTVKRFDEAGPAYPGLTYEEGMIDTLVWMLGRETEMEQPEWADE